MTPTCALVALRHLITNHGGSDVMPKLMRMLRTCSASTFSTQTFEVFRPSLPAGLPEPVDFDIRTSHLVKSSTAISNLPPESGPEFALIGYSNVGKSSIINLLTQNAQLARVSKQPGCTKVMNHFLVNKSWYLVDCPGYGEAKVSKIQRLEWHGFTKQYYISRKTLAQVFLLVDASQVPNKIDVDCALWMYEHQVPYSVVFTKVDLRVHGSPEDNIAAFVHAVSTITHQKIPYIPVCAPVGFGRESLLKYISQLRAVYQKDEPLVFKKPKEANWQQHVKAQKELQRYRASHKL